MNRSEARAKADEVFGFKDPGKLIPRVVLRVKQKGDKRYRLIESMGGFGFTLGWGDTWEEAFLKAEDTLKRRSKE